MTFSPLSHAGAGPLEERIWSALAEINDPEMPVNLVDLGLIYGLTVDEGRVCVSLTFTAMGCPASELARYCRTMISERRARATYSISSS